ncbi:MAG: serine hydrolase [Candidatus Binatia bacterium]
MPAAHFLAESPNEVGLDPQKVQTLFERAEREVQEGLLPACQIAIARNGKVGAMQTFGPAVQGGVEKPATNATFFVMMSATKALTSAAAWLLMQEGKLRPEDRAVQFVPEFGTNGKDAVTVEQLLIHTSAIPYAPHWQKDWGDKKRRMERFAQWRLDHTPGAKFVYHVSANFWPIGEIIERLSGQTFSDFVRTRIASSSAVPDQRRKNMEMVDRFLAYATAFEEAYASDDWSKLDPFFTEDAVYDFIAPAPFGEKSIGRAALLAQLKNSVNGFDRRFDSRTVELLEGPIEKDGAVWIRWAAVYTLAGAPNCRMEGEERAVFAGDRIQRLEDRVTDAEASRVGAYFAQYGAKLKPVK